MIRLAKREKYIFFFCIALFSILIMEQLVFKPFERRLSDLDDEIKVKETKLIKGLRAEAKKDQIFAEYKKYEVYFKVNGSDEEIVSDFLREIERLARESGLSILDIKPQGNNKHNMYKEYTIDIRAEAAMSSVMDFLYSLNSSVLLLRAEKIVLSLKEEGAETLKVNMVISAIAVM